jgi:hypothetical protein
LLRQAACQIRKLEHNIQSAGSKRFAARQNFVQSLSIDPLGKNGLCRFTSAANFAWPYRRAKDYRNRNRFRGSGQQEKRRPGQAGTPWKNAS